jgi:hypothetical protein
MSAGPAVEEKPVVDMLAVDVLAAEKLVAMNIALAVLAAEKPAVAYFAEEGTFLFFHIEHTPSEKKTAIPEKKIKL